MTGPSGVAPISSEPCSLARWFGRCDLDVSDDITLKKYRVREFVGESLSCVEPVVSRVSHREVLAI